MHRNWQTVGLTPAIRLALQRSSPHHHHHTSSVTTTTTTTLLFTRRLTTQRNLLLSKDRLSILRRDDSRPNLAQAKPAEEKETLISRAAVFAKEQQQLAEREKEEAKPAKLTVWQKVKAEAVHYWHGTQLLGLEIRISSKLTWKLLKGGKLTRREARQLRRTTSDIMRLVPFAVFLIVPFMELLLPVALKLFPNMLPSTYESKSQEEEKKRKLLKVRLEMAKFLQETIAESGFPGSDSAQAAQQFAEFFRKIRITGEQPSTEDLLNVAKRFQDELTLDNLSRPQLVSICKYMNINAFGTDNFLRFQIRNRMRQIKADDTIIQLEGIDSLTTSELQAACAARGIRAIATPADRLRDELAQWLDMHVNHHVPSTLLILSRAFTFTDQTISTEEALQATFNSLPDNLVNEAELQVLELVGATTYKQKLEVLEQQQELIEDESEQEQKEAEARREATAAIESASPQPAMDCQAPSDNQPPASEEPTVAPEDVPTLDDALSEEQQDELREALALLRTKIGVLEERAQLNEIKIQHEDYKELVEDLEEATHRKLDKTTQRLGKRLEKMLAKIDKELDGIEK
ncbi:LETM1-like protein-domain-containing protein [Syncephalastrum racemosum]|uniref:LETM1-like protein-domain-containing protein n=1 Tax=Syncephalastrum racemosum TaxID=13706 RepID=A0A1X2H8C3_SYNRA|nr:LETM1-like protein-domain-containing protein [Syncephalastrum racemosum]